jgi:hypothetical protein
MTYSDREIALEERFDLYRYHMRERAWYGAAVYLAEILHVSASLPVPQHAAWKSRIEKEELSEEFLQAVRSGLKQSIQRTHRILSIGTEWTGEEIMLVMQLRIEIKLVSDFLGNGVAVESTRHLKQIDDDLASLEKSKTHSSHFKWGLNQMKKHWMSDIELVWRSLIPPEQS